MASVALRDRDIDIFIALERSPLTVRQLCALSKTFCSSFNSDRRLQDRLAILARAGLLHRFRYATPEAWGQFCYTLSQESYRLLHGPDAALPSAGTFREIGMARQNHTQRLGDFIVHTLVAAHQENVQLTDFCRENALKLTVGNDCLFPDCAFSLAIPGRPPFTFYAELDNSTEPLTSPHERDTWLRKLRFYEKFQDESQARFRVLGLITKSPQRLENLRNLAAAQARNPLRSLFYGVYLPGYLNHPSPLLARLFTDHCGRSVSLLPQPDALVQDALCPLPDTMAETLTV